MLFIKIKGKYVAINAMEISHIQNLKSFIVIVMTNGNTFQVNDPEEISTVNQALGLNWPN